MGLPSAAAASDATPHAIDRALDIKAPSLGTYALWTSFELALEGREALLAVADAGVAAEADVLFHELDSAGDVVPLRSRIRLKFLREGVCFGSRSIAFRNIRSAPS